MPNCPPTPVTDPPTRPNRYRDGHTCGTCRVAHQRYATWRDAQIAAGRPLQVDADPVRAHIRTLMRPGVTQKSVADAAGVRQQTLNLLMVGSARVMARDVAEALLAVTEVAPTIRRVPSADVAHMLYQLQSHGWPLRELYYRLSGRTRTPQWVTRTHAAASTRDRVRALYAELQAVPGPCDAARAEARAAGYHPPAAYDEAEDGTWVLAEEAVAEPYTRAGRIRSRNTEAEARARIFGLALMSRGVAAREASRRCGISERGLQRAASRVGLRYERVHTRTRDLTDGTGELQLDAVARQVIAPLIRAAAAAVDIGADPEGVWRDLAEACVGARRGDATTVAA